MDHVWTVEDHLRDADPAHVALYRRVEALILGQGDVEVSVSKTTITFKGRRRGFAGDALRQVIPRAAARGIPRLLVTCDLDNIASARTIEANGGELEGELRGKRRYWIAV